MARRRGFFAELQHQAAVAERDRQRAHAAAVREAQKQQREAVRARAAAERARVAAGRADARAQAEAEREAKRLHVEAREAEVEAMNARLTSQLEEIDGVLAWTLTIDDHVDLETLRQTAEHPPFHSVHQTPLTAPTPSIPPVEPVCQEPPAPTGLGGMFKKKEHQAAVERARAAYDAQHARWQADVAALPDRDLERMRKHEAAEATRKTKLATDRATYDADCRQREAQVAADNAELDDLIRRYAAGDKDAVEEYCGIVFANSVYPDVLNFGISLEYHATDRELEIVLTLPRPDEIPTVKAYKYVKPKDEISEQAQTAKEQRDRYTNLVHSIVLRTLHEMWESDRAHYIDTISLTAGVEHIDPATGRPTTTPLVALATDRAAFEHIDLAHVTPAETLRHLKAVVSKNPHALAPIPSSSGVRG